jgi:hypothetical protein
MAAISSDEKPHGMERNHTRQNVQGIFPDGWVGQASTADEVPTRATVLPRFRKDREREFQTDVTAPWELGALIEAGKKERNRDRKPYKEGRVVGVVAAAVILAAIVPTAPVAGAVPSVGVVPSPPVAVVPLTPVSVVPIAPVIVAVVVSVAAGMNGGMTGMDGTSLR